MKKKVISLLLTFVMIFSSLMLFGACSNGDYELKVIVDRKLWVNSDVNDAISVYKVESDGKTTLCNDNEYTVYGYNKAMQGTQQIAVSTDNEHQEIVQIDVLCNYDYLTYLKNSLTDKANQLGVSNAYYTVDSTNESGSYQEITRVDYTNEKIYRKTASNGQTLFETWGIGNTIYNKAIPTDSNYNFIEDCASFEETLKKLGLSQTKNLYESALDSIIFNTDSIYGDKAETCKFSIEANHLVIKSEYISIFPGFGAFHIDDINMKFMYLKAYSNNSFSQTKFTSISRCSFNVADVGIPTLPNVAWKMNF